MLDDDEEPEKLPRRTVLSAVRFRTLVIAVALAVVGVIAISYLSDRWASPSRPTQSRAGIEVPPPPPLPQTAPARQETVHAPLAPPPARSEPAVQPARTETKAARKPEAGAPAASPQRSRAGALAGGEYWIQVGAFTEPANAARLAARLTSENYPVKRAAIERPAGDSQTNAGTFHAVRVGGYPARQRAEAVRKELEGKGFPGFLVRAQRQ